MTVVVPKRADSSSATSPRLADSRRAETVRPLGLDRKRRIGRFELIREIASGGMGQVFLGRDTKLGRKVAIKFLLRDDPEFLQRFLVEARATALCTHENIVTIYEFGEHERLPYMVLEYLEGKTLHEVLQTKPTPRQFAELVVPVVRALERAHEHGIVHRDLKPSNIFVTTRGQVKVLDFGIARLIDTPSLDRTPVHQGQFEELDRSGAFTSAKVVVGTFPYMSPEQWGMGEVDHLSDFWALGILFWRALTGVHPAGTANPEALRERVCDMGAPMPSIAMRDPSLPRPLVEIVDRCLAKRKPDRYRHASELLHDLQAFLVPPPDRPTGENPPFRGLAAFSEEDAEYFFGRSNEIRTGVARLAANPLLAVIGPSGVGKSSFVHAGLVPALRASGGNWHVCLLRPGRAPLQRLATALEETLATGEQAHDLINRLRDAPGLFGEMLRSAADRRNTNVLVVVDQLEELFTLADDEVARNAFLAALLAAADDTGTPVRVVLSMRADFLDRLASHRDFLSELSRNLFFLAAPDRENLRETLERPAELAGYVFESREMVDDMLQVATSRGALSLLSFAANRLWEERDRRRKVMPAAAYSQMGGVGGAFARHADQVVSAIPPNSQGLLRSILTRLVTPDGTRAVVDHAELVSLARDKQSVDKILDHLVAARLIQIHTDPVQGATVEIVHEMLISEWPTLRRWLEGNQAIRAFAHELRQAARQWQSRGTPADLVWRGATAEEALRHAKELTQLSSAEEAFLAAIRQQLARGRRRRVVALTAVVAVLALGLGGALFAYARIQQENRRALDAKAQLQKQVNALEAAQRARAAAEDAKVQESGRRAQIEKDYAALGQLSKEQLEAKNRELLEQIARKEEEAQRASEATHKAEEATRRMDVERQKTAKANAELQTANKELAERAKADRAARDAAERKLKNAGIVVDLKKRGP